MNIEMSASVGTWRKVIEALKVHAAVVDLAVERGGSANGSPDALDQRRRSEGIKGLSHQIELELQSVRNDTALEAEEHNRRRYNPEADKVSMRNK